MQRKTGPVSWRTNVEPTDRFRWRSDRVRPVVRLAEALDDIPAEKPASDINRRCARSLCGRLAA